jgi:hypothetical protein
MNIDDVISYSDLVSAEGINLQKGMNFGIKKSYSIFLMSVRENAPYSDVIDKETGNLIYEGHDEPHSAQCPDPKVVDQPLLTSTGRWTENGKFLRAAVDFKSGVRATPEYVKVYEKITRGIWCYKGFFALVDARINSDGRRKVFKFHLHPVEKRALGRVVDMPHTRMVPTTVKLEVWRRDGGRCVICGSTTNLHYDHEIPYSKGGSSLVAENVRLLCAKHNLEKSDKIMTWMPWMVAAGSAISSSILRN